ncbi:MAG: hypothetical protein IJW62_09170, partial [Clostridia bacterium]|nr:hypothetical protein [Clostridia bacterium]
VSVFDKNEGFCKFCTDKQAIPIGADDGGSSVFSIAKSPLRIDFFSAFVYNNNRREFGRYGRIT